ncbi:protein phosphatase 2C domain-containing protein [Actinocorallia longicatena]|uniref:PPM-type phosphatase domain-containing protein n=1 Tax=Actinocorallia longicatena TaxID=111803 RepID=A0ABP6QHE6_9ACTN
MTFLQIVCIFTSGACLLNGIRGVIAHAPFAVPAGLGRMTGPDRPAVPQHSEPRAIRAPSGASGLEPRYVGRTPSPVSVLLPASVLSDQPSVQAEHGMWQNVTVRAASRRGRSHMRRGEPLQDAFMVLPSEDRRWIIAVIADGVGGSAYAEVAARTAVASTIRELGLHLRNAVNGPTPAGWRAVFSEVAADVGDARKSVHGYPGTDRKPLPSTTVVAMVAPADARPGDTVFVAGIGDSMALLLRGGTGQWEGILGPSGSSSDSGNDPTAALPADLGDLRTLEHGWARDEVLMLATDGFARGLGRGNSLRDDLAKAWRRPPELLSFLRDVEFKSATFDDDRTVVALWQGAFDRQVK